MNLEEFGALKVGDKIVNPMSGVSTNGIITKVTPSGVRVRWGESVQQYYYSVITTAWMHWSKVEEK